MSAKEKTYVEATCGHCDGAGCTYCNKTGIVLVATPTRLCPHCEGVGCIYCGFTGWADPKEKYD
jgi:DnaJ-class molecular chaperone